MNRELDVDSGKSTRQSIRACRPPRGKGYSMKRTASLWSEGNKTLKSLKKKQDLLDTSLRDKKQLNSLTKTKLKTIEKEKKTNDHNNTSCTS